MVRMPPLLQSCVLVAILVVAAAARAKAEDLNDYPTSARADYVFGCMKANGETPELLQKCSCSIDVIASIIPYDGYVAAETILSMSQVSGPVGSEFRSTEPARRKQKSAASDRTRLLIGRTARLVQARLVRERNQPAASSSVEDTGFTRRKPVKTKD